MEKIKKMSDNELLKKYKENKQKIDEILKKKKELKEELARKGD